MTFRSLFIFSRLLLIGLASAATVSCSVRNMMIDEVVGTMETGLPAFEQESDLELLEKALPANIKLLETFLAGNPTNARLLVLLSRMYAGYTFAFVEGRLDAAMLADYPPEDDTLSVEAIKASLNRYYLRGAEFAMNALEIRYPDCRAQLGKVATTESFFEDLTEADVPALFWYAFNLGAHVNQNRDDMQAIAKAYLAEKAMQRVIELDEAYYNGGAHLFLMVYYASRSPMMGGNPEKARAHYDRLKTLAGVDFLIADVYYARYYLYRTQNRQAYEETLNRVLKDPPTEDIYPLLNAVAVKRAETYLGATNRLFE